MAGFHHDSGPCVPPSEPNKNVTISARGNLVVILCIIAHALLIIPSFAATIIPCESRQRTGHPIVQSTLSKPESILSRSKIEGLYSLNDLFAICSAQNLNRRLGLRGGAPASGAMSERSNRKRRHNSDQRKTRSSTKAKTPDQERTANGYASYRSRHFAQPEIIDLFQSQA